MKRSRGWLLLLALVAGFGSWVLYGLSALDEPEAPESSKDRQRREVIDKRAGRTGRDGTGAGANQPLPPTPPRRPNEGTDFPNMRPAPPHEPPAASPAPTSAPVDDRPKARRTEVFSGPMNIGDAGVGPFAVDKEGVVAALRAALPAIKECYEEWRRLDPNLHGELSVQFAIDPDFDAGVSRVADIGLKTDGSAGEAAMGSAAFRGCVLASMADLPFDLTEGRVEAVFPLKFKSGDP